MGWLWYPTKKIKQLINLCLVVVGIILIGFELRPLWTHLMMKLWASPMEFVRECMWLISGIPYVALLQAFCVVMGLLPNSDSQKICLKKWLTYVR